MQFTVEQLSLLAGQLIEMAIYLLPAILVLAVVKGVLTSPTVKGAMGESFTSRWVLRKLDSRFYTVHNDFYLPRPDGTGTTQIDHVVVSPFGVFVIETKNMTGWIFGDAKSRQWTQTIYRKKVRFQNPLHQNALHVNALASHLELSRDQLTNIVFFVGDVTLKTTLPPNVLTSGLRRFIEGHQIQRLSHEECERIRFRLREVDPGKDRKAVKLEHLRGIRKRRMMRAQAVGSMNIHPR